MPITWLSNVGNEDFLGPEEPLETELSAGTVREQGERGDSLDGLEYLIAKNSFFTVLQFIQSLKDPGSPQSLGAAGGPEPLYTGELNLLGRKFDIVL